MKLKFNRAAPRPRAIIFLNDSAFAGVCAWCADKDEADAWCRDRGYAATHGICPTCRARLRDKLDAERGWRVA